MSEPVKTFRIPKGSLESADARWHLEDYLLGLDREKAWKVTVEAWKGSRSISQNRLLWALYDDIIRQGGEMLAGWDREDIHEFCLGSCYGWEKLSGLGRERLRPLRRSSAMTKPEFSDFLEFIVRFFAEKGIILELPGDE